MGTTRENSDGFYLLLLGCISFLLIGTALWLLNPVKTNDFRAAYFSARCLLRNGDPYNDREVQKVLQAEGGENSFSSENARIAVTRYVYLPSAFTFTVPFAMLPWRVAQFLWMSATAASIILAAFLMWKLGAKYAPVLSGFLVAFSVANNVNVMINGNPAGIAVSFCMIAVWCFLEQKFVVAGVLCLASSLALKPHDAGLVWLLFLLAGGIYRKRALQSLVVAVAVCIPAVLWVSHVAPDWIPELRSNLVAFSIHGGINDPGPDSAGAHGILNVTNMQAVFSYFRDEPSFYNAMSYILCGPMILIWAVVTLRRGSTPIGARLALATIAPLLLLPIYHRSYDAKLILLTVPACTLLWAAGGRVGKLAILASSAAIVLNGDLTRAAFFFLVSALHLSTAGLSGKFLTLVQVSTVPVTLLLVGTFYLWIFARPFPANQAPEIR